MTIDLHQITMHELPLEPTTSPYTPDVPGFNEHSWWTDFFLGKSGVTKYRPLSFTDEYGNEVARVLLIDDQTLVPNAACVQFLEVRLDLYKPHRHGVGTHVLQMLQETAGPAGLFAQPKPNAKGFWDKSGWEHRLIGDSRPADLYVWRGHGGRA